MAQALDLYVNGSLNFFNHRTTVDIRNRLVCFDIKGLGKNLKKPGMLIVQDAVWNTVTVNRSIGRATWYFVDEFHLLLKEEQTAGSVFTYNFDDQRKYTAHVDVNSEEMERCIQELRTKKRNIYSLGVIENKFELSMANLYVHEDFMFFIFDLKNKSYIDYDIEFVKCFQRDQKKSKNAIQQETTIEPIYQKDFDTKIKGKSRNRLILGFDKFTIPDDKVFEIEIYERNGGRHIKLAVLNEYILSAEPLYKPQP